MLLKNIIDYLGNILHKFEHSQSKEFVIQVGPQYDFAEKIVKKVLITQYLTLKTINYAKKNKFNLIICKYGLPFDSFLRIDETLQKYLLLLQQSHIMVGVLPSSWYYIADGPIEYIAKILGLHFDQIFLDHNLRCIGKGYSAEKSLEFDSVLSILHRSLNIEIIQAYSKADTFNRLFCIIPEKVTPSDIRNTKFLGCDCIICPEILSPSLSYLMFYEISYIQIPFHYVLEATLSRLCSILAMEFPRNEFGFYPSEIMVQTYCRKQNH